MKEQKSYYGKVKMIYIDIFLPTLIQSYSLTKSPKPHGTSGFGLFVFCGQRFSRAE